jgi:ethanolamine utilization protein EutA
MRSCGALAGGVVVGLWAWLDAGQPLVLALEADLGRSVGHILTEELGVVRSVICIDGIELRELDYVDIGQLVQPANVIPVVVKSLAFAPAGIAAS